MHESTGCTRDDRLIPAFPRGRFTTLESSVPIILPDRIDAFMVPSHPGPRAPTEDLNQRIQRATDEANHRHSCRDERWSRSSGSLSM